MGSSFQWHSLAAYFAGEATPDERAALEVWIQADVSRGPLVAQLRDVWLQAGAGDNDVLPLLSPVDVAAAQQRLATRFAEVHNRQPASPPIRPNQVKWVRVLGKWGVAAAAVVVVASATMLWRRPPMGLPVRDLATNAGNQAAITLRDGTRVVLGPASHLYVPGDFGGRVRSVELEGEAYFSVVHDAAHPFVLHTARLTVTDVGTQFDVRAYIGDSSVRVAVAEGEVALATLASHDRTLALRAGDVATVGAMHVDLSHQADVAALTAWMQHGLVFQNTPLPDVAKEIGRLFGVSVNVADSTLRTRRITASFVGQPLDVVLDEVTRVLGAHYERVDGMFVIRSHRATSRERPPEHVQPLTTVQQ